MPDEEEKTGEGYVDLTLLEAISESYNSHEEWQKARVANKNIDAKMEINAEEGTETWVCSECREKIVADINGDRAQIRAVNGTLLFVKFNEMAAFCKKCEKFNTLMESYKSDALFEADENKLSPERPDSFFAEDYSRAEAEIKKQGENIKTDKKESKIISKFLLKLK